MTTQSIEEIISVKEQRFVLPGRQSWQQFKGIQALMAEVPGVRVSYLDGCVEHLSQISPITSENEKSIPIFPLK